MKQISLRVSDVLYKFIVREAAISRLTVTDYIIHKINPYLNGPNVTLSDVLKKVKQQPAGTTFTLPSIFDDWKIYSTGSKISVGRSFFSAVKNNDYTLSERVQILSKNSANLQQYKKLTND